MYVPVPEGFEADKVEFVAKTKHISLKLDGEEARFFLCCFSFFLEVGTQCLFRITISHGVSKMNHLFQIVLYRFVVYDIHV